METRARNAPPARSPGEAPPDSGLPNGGSDPAPGSGSTAIPCSIPDGWQPKPAALDFTFKKAFAPGVVDNAEHQVQPESVTGRTLWAGSYNPLTKQIARRFDRTPICWV